MYRVSPLPLTFTFNCVDGDAVDLDAAVRLAFLVDFVVDGFAVDVNDFIVDVENIGDVGDCDETSSPSFLHSLVKEDASAG